MIVRSPSSRQHFSDGVYIGYHQLFVSFIYLSSDDVSNTTTQSDSSVNPGYNTELEEGAGVHRSAGCF